MSLLVAGGLDQMSFKGSFQPKPFCDSVILCPGLVGWRQRLRSTGHWERVAPARHRDLRTRVCVCVFVCVCMCTHARVFVYL